MNFPRQICIGLIRVYQLVLSPAKFALFGPMARCRFEPCCSAYALEAVRRRGALAGSALALKRICRCHPWGGCGHDPVPSAGPGRNDSAGRASLPAGIDIGAEDDGQICGEPSACRLVRPESAPAGGQGCPPYGAIRFHDGVATESFRLGRARPKHSRPALVHR